MQKTEKQTISPRQLALMLTICLTALRVILSPSLIAQIARQDTFIAFFIASILSFCGIVLSLYVVEKNKGKGFDQILSDCFGKFFAKIILFLIFIFFVYKLIAADFGMKTFLLESLYENLNWNVFLIPVIFVVAYLAFKGPRVLGRTSEMFFVFGAFVFILALVIAVPNVKIQNALPLLSQSAKNILNGVLVGFSIGGEYLFVLIMCENLDNQKTYHKKAMLYGAVTLFALCIMMFIFVCVFGNLSIFLDDALTKISLFLKINDQNSRVDTIITLTWLFYVIIYCAINYYCASWALQKILGIKKFLPCIAIVTAIIYLLTIFNVFSIETIVITNKLVLPFLAIFLELLIPLVLFLIVIIKRKINHEKVA